MSYNTRTAEVNPKNINNLHHKIVNQHHPFEKVSCDLKSMLSLSRMISLIIRKIYKDSKAYSKIHAKKIIKIFKKISLLLSLSSNSQKNIIKNGQITLTSVKKLLPSIKSINMPIMMVVLEIQLNTTIIHINIWKTWKKHLNFMNLPSNQVLRLLRLMTSWMQSITPKKKSKREKKAKKNIRNRQKSMHKLITMLCLLMLILKIRIILFTVLKRKVQPIFLPNQILVPKQTLIFSQINKYH